VDGHITEFIENRAPQRQNLLALDRLVRGEQGPSRGADDAPHAIGECGNIDDLEQVIQGRCIDDAADDSAESAISRLDEPAPPGAVNPVTLDAEGVDIGNVEYDLAPIAHDGVGDSYHCHTTKRFARSGDEPSVGGKNTHDRENRIETPGEDAQARVIDGQPTANQGQALSVDRVARTDETLPRGCKLHFRLARYR
jgi:hypothetical protein